ncbi:hypothetical protein F5B19DRAFT_494765 [Rostrohypoxylon terebratum]|nr:hypothetical protein F5B19DRAFT_494765 [Rostrohypoxylon terebratum]
MVASPSLLFIYTALTVYAAACSVLAIKVTNEYMRNERYCFHRQPTLVKWCLRIVGWTVLTALFVAIVVPVFLFMCGVAFIWNHVKCWGRRKNKDIDAAERSEADSWTTSVGSPVSFVTRDGEHGINIQMHQYVMGYPGKPQPAHFQGHVESIVGRARKRYYIQFPPQNTTYS